MSVLVTYASAYGSTALIARQIAQRLGQDGMHVETESVEVVGTPEGYDAVIVGSAVHNMAWLPTATQFVEKHAASLVGHPIWLFSVSSVGDTTSFFGPRVARLMRRLRHEPKTISGLRPLVRPRDHRNFAGAVERSHWNLAGHAFLRTFGGTYGDHRDHADITAWADTIAKELLAGDE
jgi:menaquinone-dependent protoporphyrinogen oxidase